MTLAPELPSDLLRESASDKTITVPAMMASMKNGSFKAKDLLDMYGDLPAEENYLLLNQAFGQSEDFIKNMQMASTSLDSMSEDELKFVVFKESTSFRADFDEHYFKVSPP